ncbi:MAG: PepSY domain-containing protein [Pseudomonadota bacterium]
MRITVKTTVLLAALSAATTPVWAQSSPPLASPLTFDEAIAVALAQQPGEIAEIALERAGGRVVIDIEVVTAAGEEVEFHLHPVTGEVLMTWVDDDPSDDPGASDDKD